MDSGLIPLQMVNGALLITDVDLLAAVLMLTLMLSCACVLQFGDVTLYVRILHHRDTQCHSVVPYNPLELSKYRAFLTAAVNSSY